MSGEARQGAERRLGWFLFALAFIAVYREVFETIIFFAAMGEKATGRRWSPASPPARGPLAPDRRAMLRFSAQLPIAKFFAYSSMADRRARGRARRQGRRGVAGSRPSRRRSARRLPRSPVLGMFPTLQGIVAQVLSLAILLVGFALNSNRSRRLSAA